MQLSPYQIEDDVRFWLGQDAEHCLFFSLGFVDPALKSHAERLHAAYLSVLARDDLRTGLGVLERSQAFKQRALAAAQARWVGWIFPLFIDHTHRELAVMQARIRPGGISSRAELSFIDRIGQEHCEFAAQLLDPTEKETQDAASTAGAVAAHAKNSCATETYGTLLALSQNSGAAIDRLFSGLDLAKTRSVIHPVLAAHVVRESKRFVSTMSQLPTIEVS